MNNAQGINLVINISNKMQLTAGHLTKAIIDTFTDDLGNYYRRYRKWEINYLIFIEFRLNENDKQKL
jgi:hypothetical protein